MEDYPMRRKWSRPGRRRRCCFQSRCRPRRHSRPRRCPHHCCPHHPRPLPARRCSRLLSPRRFRPPPRCCSRPRPPHPSFPHIAVARAAGRATPVSSEDASPWRTLGPAAPRP
eukprot:scaffold5962_cov103-Isochrysis_galbana.AAC.5